MTKEIISDGVLVYDRYYCSRPNTPLLIIKRILLAAAFCACSILFILTEYKFPVSLPVMGAVCAGSCIGFSALFVFVKKRFAIPGIILLSIVIIWYDLEALEERLTYFADACMLLVEGRFLYPRRFLFHRGEVLDASNPAYVEGVVLGTVLMCLLYSLIISACFSGRLVPVPAALLFIALCVPVLISEQLEFSFWLIPALAALAGIFAIKKNYSGGLAVKHSSSSDYRRRIKHEERTFIKRISGAPFIKRIEMQCNYRCKYFSTGMYCAALTAISITIGALIIPEGRSIDYTSVYEFITSFGTDNSVVQSPFEEGTASEYFTQNGAEEKDTLNIISPGRGEREIIRVTYTGNRPVYLRGDIGIDFTGSSWTTAVSSEPSLWRDSGLKETYRPCEGRVISALLSATTESVTQNEPIITSSDVNIEYLCSTNVVFLPPYTAEYSFYNNDNFDVYSDYAVRVKNEAGSVVNSVQCTALVPSYTSNERYTGSPEAVEQLDYAFDSVMCTPNDIYSSVVPEMSGNDVLSKYESYVEQTYTGIPDEFSTDIEEYTERTIKYVLDGIKAEYTVGNISEALYRYNTAGAVADYLRTHYTYSLDGSNNSRNPVMQFLNDTKRGHCSLYASAMTLILRERGIPARYCTGFYVEGEDGRNSVLLREKNLHAWVEVYLGQYGWATFDPTSSSAYPDRSTVTVPESTADSASEIPSDTAELTSETIDSSDLITVEPSQQAAGSAESTDDGSAEVIAPPALWDMLRPLIPAVLAVMVVILALVGILVRLSALKKSARRTLEDLRTGGSGASRTVYRLILALLDYKNIKPASGELPVDYFRRADETFGTQLSECADIFAEMEFGGHEISEEETAFVDSQLEKLLDALRPFRFPGKVRVLKLIGEFTKFY